MRIIRGTHKGRKILAPPTIKARPTTDFAKEGLFNILDNQLEYREAEVLDLFAGTGNISFEFASRGCSNIYSVDNSRASFEFIASTADTWNLSNVKPVKQDAFAYLKACSATFDVIFADPPFLLEEVVNIPEIVFSRQLLKPGGLLIVEHSEAIDFTAEKHFLKNRSYGKVNFSFFSS